MAEKITPREKDFSQWYQDIVLQAKLADYSPVKGCMVIRPNGYAIWEKIQKVLDRKFKETGHQNAYFPLFIPESFLKKEAEHVEGFAPQCAVVTHAGAKDLEEKLVVRPTSETIINSMFSKWIQSYRDLPLLINQWANVVRWEMRTRLFLRTTEFLWQEGHTCHETAQEAEAETVQMLKVYQEFLENTMAIPVVAGIKSQSEKFAGAEKTYCVEVMLQDGKALQAGTSHYLGQNFAKAFETKFQNREGQWEYVHQTSWGVSTRLIGGLIMTHSDDKGLVLPPRLAHQHIRIIPILKDLAQDPLVLKEVERLKQELETAAPSSPFQESITVHIDRDTQHSPGWKFHECELLGIPLRIEIGARDLKQNQLTYVRRDMGVKKTVSIADAVPVLLNELAQMQNDLFIKAQERVKAKSFLVEDYGDFKARLETVGGFFYAPWCESAECETQVKEETKATIRCLPLNEAGNWSPEPGKCMVCKQPSKGRVVFARNY